MNADERQVLMRALDSLSSVTVDTHVYAHQRQYNESAYDYDVLGRQILISRMLAEFVGIPHEHLLPGEFYEDESDLPGLLVYTPTKRSAEGEPLLDSEKKWLQANVLPVLNHVSGVSDSDDAVLRCVKREIAEVAGYPDLSRYRLMLENEVKPLYFNAYVPVESGE